MRDPPECDESDFVKAAYKTAGQARKKGAEQARHAEAFFNATHCHVGSLLS